MSRLKQGDYEVVSARLVARLHWLQGTMVVTNIDTFREVILRAAELLGDELDWTCGPLGRGKKYDRSGRGAKGFFFAWNEPNDNRQGEAWISIPGDLIDSLPLECFGSVCLLLQQFGFKATRIDCAIDDFSKKITPELLLEKARQGNFARFRYRAVGEHPPSYQFYVSPQVNSQGEVEEAMTVYFGGKGSDKKFYCYRKDLESKGETDSIRFEARFADEQAHSRFEVLCECYKNRGFRDSLVIVGGFCLGAIDFVDRSIGTRLDEHPRFDWWQELEDALGGLRIPVPRAVPTVEKIADWSHKQWETSLRIFELVAGTAGLFEFVGKLVESGTKRIKSRHLALARSAISSEFNLINYSNLIM